MKLGNRVVALSSAAALSLAGLGLATLGPGGVAGAATAPAPKISWSTCSQSSLSATGAECGFLSVPLDWDKPTGQKIELAVSRMKATVPATARQGVMLVNPGGPGGSGLGLSTLRDVIKNDAGKSYDWIGFDPRGVGASKPAISCDPTITKGPRPDYVPDTHTAKLSKTETVWLERSKKYAATCGKKYPDLLAHMKTTDTVRDMDYLRQALGEKQINYYGFSYGTYLGEVYATMFPTHVDHMVLDGNVDPRGVWYTSQLAQDRAFQGVADHFFGWVAKHHDTYNVGTTTAAVQANYNKVLKALEAKPKGTIGADEWTDAFVHGMYAEFLWPDTADALASYINDKGDIGAARVAYNNSLDADDNGFAVYNAVNCTDAAWPGSYEKTWRPDAFSTAAKAPFMTWSNVWYNTSCLYWPAKPGIPVTVDGTVLAKEKSSPGVLLVNATLDGATPYTDALHVRALFPSARLIAEQGATSHANSLGGNPCIEDRIADYLANGALPARKAGDGPDVKCNRIPMPQPGFTKYGASANPDPLGNTPPDPNRKDKPAPPATDRNVVDSIVGLLPSRR
ncbi:MAG TPA: alpha/beta hydrolase [Sporichthyaceae bacterium]